MFTDLTKEQYAENLKKYLSEHKDEFSGNINKEIATICVETQDEGYWKPRLSLRIEIEDDKTAIRGIFGPSSAVWTFFHVSLLFFFYFCGWYFFSMYYVEKTN